MNFNRFSVGTGHFNLADFSDLSVEVRFYLRKGAPFERTWLQFVYSPLHAQPESYDGLSVLEAAKLCKSEIDRYLINRDKERIAELVAYLETTDIQDQLESKAAELKELTYRVQELTEEIELLKESLIEDEPATE